MGVWDNIATTKMKQGGLQTELNKRFVDDIRNLLRALKMGWKWSPEISRMEFKEEWLEEDKKSGESKELRTVKEVLRITPSCLS